MMNDDAMKAMQIENENVGPAISIAAVDHTTEASCVACDAVRRKIFEESVALSLAEHHFLLPYPTRTVQLYP
jgi:hypothetical protein